MKLEPLDPVIAALLAPEREIPRVADVAIDAALERAITKGEILLSTAPPGGYGLPHARGFGLKALAASVAGGAVVGSLVTYALLGPRREEPAAPSPVVSASTSVPNIPPETPSADPGPPSIPLSALPAESQRPVSTAPHGSAEPSHSSSDIARERELVDAARAALAKGHVDEASRLLREHDSEFPRGQLGEEREALQIVALARGGKKDEARTRLSSFRKSHGSSPLLPMLEAEVGPPRPQSGEERGDAGP